MSNDLYNLEETPEFTKEEKERIVSKLEAIPPSPSIGILMPKLAYRYRVTFDKFGYGDGIDITRNLVACSTPTYFIDADKFSTFTIKIRNDISNLVIREIYEQLKQQKENKATFTCTIDILDGMITNIKTPLEQRVFFNCRIIKISYSDLDYALSEAQDIILEIETDNCKMQF